MKISSTEMVIVKSLLLICFIGNNVLTFPTYDFGNEEENGDWQYNNYEDSNHEVTLDDDTIWDNNQDSRWQFNNYDDSIDEVSMNDDIILDDRIFVVGPNDKSADGSDTRELLMSNKYLWPNGEIPYVIADDFDSKEKKYIFDAMDHIRNRTCISFVNNHAGNYYDFVFFLKSSNPNNCSSKIGKYGGEQHLYLGSKCFFEGMGRPIHEILHVLGLWHEHARPDRDLYVDVNWKEVDQQRIRRINYLQRDWGYSHDACEEYDYNSIMHYSLGNTTGLYLKQTLTDNKKIFAGQRFGMSRTDVLKLNRMYRCFEWCEPDCPKPYDLEDQTEICKTCPLQDRQQCLKELAELTFCS